MSTRRNFLRCAGPLGIFSSLFISQFAYNKIKATPQDTTKLGPPADTTNTIALCGQYSTIPKGDSMFNTSPTTNSVSMTVGRDDRLWIKVGDDWKRVSIEA